MDNELKERLDSIDEKLDRLVELLSNAKPCAMSLFADRRVKELDEKSKKEKKDA